VIDEQPTDGFFHVRTSRGKEGWVGATYIDCGTGTQPDAATQRWTVEEVIAAIRARRDTFYVQDSKNNIAEVIVADCPVHGHNHFIITTVADNRETDNLLDLRDCNWKQQ
jgi:hypothetical protein